MAYTSNGKKRGEHKLSLVKSMLKKLSFLIFNQAGGGGGGERMNE